MQHFTSSGDALSPDIYRQLFDAVDAGFCIGEVLFDGDRPFDYRFLEVNRGFEQQTGLLIRSAARLMNWCRRSNDTGSKSMAELR